MHDFVQVLGSNLLGGGGQELPQLVIIKLSQSGSLFPFLVVGLKMGLGEF